MAKMAAGAAIVLLMGVAAARAATIGIDAVHGWDAAGVMGTGGDFETYRAVIESKGHTIFFLYDFKPTTLAGLNAMVVLQPYSQNDHLFSPKEIEAVHDFVSGGGGLVLHADCGVGSDGGLADMNTLASPYGVTFSFSESEGEGHTLTDLVPHPVTTGVSTIGVDYQRRLTGIDPPALDLTRRPDADDVLAAVNGGPVREGNVVCLSDSDLWSSGGDRPITFADNRRLLENTMDFITAEPPALPGDADLDGDVDLDDFVILKSNFGTVGALWSEGDFNADWVVNLDDFVILKANFGATVVPEPAALAVLALGAMLGPRRRR
ncbi:MAG: DUF4350 domain-containing protein [Planctomycetota bacterium]